MAHVESTTAGAALRRALAAQLSGSSTPALSRGVERLMAAYRSGEVPGKVLLSTLPEVAAYAAYRMPATFGATHAALLTARSALPGVAVESAVDIGAGTGAASWAMADAFAPSEMTLLEQSDEAIAFGRRLAEHAPDDALRSAAWRSWRLSAGAIPAADLAVAAYVLGELDAPSRTALVGSAASAAGIVALLEPGTPRGYGHIVAARAQLISLGMRIAAPCPHDGVCPLLSRNDWCHFAARIPRSDLHRRVKDAELQHEDEKFSYVVATRDPPIDRPAARVLRHPLTRKGLVSLELCVDDDLARTTVVSKSKGALYKAARRTDWGDGWPPEGDT